MPRVGFEPTIAAFERAKMVHAFYRASTLIGVPDNYFLKLVVLKMCMYFHFHCIYSDSRDGVGSWRY
jgi:hypothetical protein